MLVVNLMELIRIFLWFIPDTVSCPGVVLLCLIALLLSSFSLRSFLLSFFFLFFLFCLVFYFLTLFGFAFFSRCVGFALIWIKKQIRSN